MIASHADFRPEDYAFPRTQSRYSGKLVPSPPPIRRTVASVFWLVRDVAAEGMKLTAEAIRQKRAGK